MEDPREEDSRDMQNAENPGEAEGNNDGTSTNEVVEATTEDFKENNSRRSDEISRASSDHKKTGNGQPSPHQQQQQQQQPHPAQQVPIQPAYSYNFPQNVGFMPSFIPAPSNLTGQAALNPSRYTDAAYIADPVPDLRRNRGGVTEPFPEKLHKMLEVTEAEGSTDIVGFFSHGRAFAIHQPRKFVADIMPRFFKQSRLTSFQRQLNLYGFKRISQYVFIFLDCWGTMSTISLTRVLIVAFS